MPLPELIRQLAGGLRKLHSIPARDCPFDETVGARLARARAAIAEGLVDADGQAAASVLRGAPVLVIVLDQFPAQHVSPRSGEPLRRKSSRFVRRLGR
jgi:hypothetical protein